MVLNTQEPVVKSNGGLEPLPHKTKSESEVGSSVAAVAECAESVTSVSSTSEIVRKVELFGPLEKYSIFTRYGLKLILYLVRGILKIALVLYKYVWCPLPFATANDHKPVYEGIAVKRGIKYGEVSREFMDCIVPVPARKERHIGFFNIVKEIVRNCGGGHIEKHAGKKNVIVFLHGGGWVIEGSDVQLQQLTSWVRAGYTVYSVNYPLAPEHRFPIPLVSFLKALRTLHNDHGVESVHVVGESAGANLTSLGIAILKNPDLCKKFSEGTGNDFHTWDFPKVLSYCCWYGVLDKLSWRATPGKWMGFHQGTNSVFKYGLELCFKWYESDENIMENKTTLLEYEEYIEEYVPTQFISGGVDPIGLQSSNKTAHEMLVKKGIKSETVMLENLTHGGVAYPPQIQKYMFFIDIENGCIKANKEIMRFFDEHSE